MSLSRRPARRSPEGAAYHRLYGTERWRQKARWQIRSQPLCEECERHGRVAAATVAHHRIPHRGDLHLFWHGDLESVCKRCHDSSLKSAEVIGYSSELGLDGFPIDPRHPWNSGVAPRGLSSIRALFWPNVMASALPLTIVCGPPAAGKSTYVRSVASPTDIIIDLDDIITEQNPKNARSSTWDIRRVGLEERNRRLARLASETSDGRRAWFLTGAPKALSRARWARMLRAESVLLIHVPKQVGIQRVMADPHRQANSNAQVKAIERWWASYTRSPNDHLIVDPAPAVLS